MRDLLRVLAFIGALSIVAIGTLLGFIGIALGITSSEPEMLALVTPSASVAVLSLGLGSASVWHAWRAIQGHPSAAFRSKRVWLLVMLYLLALVLGQAMLTQQLVPALTFPFFHIAATVLPALIIVAVVGRWLGGATTWRDIVLQAACGAFVAIPLAFMLEAIAILLIASATFFGLAWQPGGQDLILKLTSYLQDPAWLQDPGALGPALLTPAVIVAAFALVAGLIPVIEEAVKTIGVGMMSYRRPSLPQAVLWGLAAGAGFSVAEGLLNTTTVLGAWLPVVLMRVGTTLLHCLTGALMGLAWYQILGKRRWSRGLALYLISVAIHGLWNGLAIAVSMLSFEAVGTDNTSAGQLMAGLGTLTVFLLLAVLALGTAGGLAGLTIYARRLGPLSQPTGKQTPPVPVKELSFEDADPED